MSNSSLLKDILSMEETESCEPSLVSMYKHLLLIGERLREGIQSSIVNEVNEKTRDKDGDESSESNSEKDSEDEEEDDEEENDGNEDSNKKEDRKESKTDMERLLAALELHKQQKQNLLIKKAILLKFEEALFGNNNITMTIDLRQLGEEEKDGKLEEILKCKDLTKYMPKSETENGVSMEFAEKAALRETIKEAKSPPDILTPFRPKTPKKIAVNLIHQQYNIRWNTKSGESKPFDFFDLPKQFRKGIVRKAHIQTVLYEHKAEITNLPAVLNVTTSVEKEDFCPNFLYVKKDPYAQKEDSETNLVRLRDDPKFSWQRWGIQGGDCDDLGFEFPAELKWIDPKVKTLIKKLCEPISDDFNPQTTKNVMYLFVVTETTSPRLTVMGNTSQIYIGGADDGILVKLLEGEDSHCSKMKQLYERFISMEAFEADSSNSLLVEMRLLLALARREQFAVFALKEYEDARSLGKALHDLVIQALYLADNEIWGPAVNMCYGLNVKEELKKRRKFLPPHFPGSNRKHKK
ncbi:uncharacterized protein LOC144744359 [Ciona intestinalis]